MENNFEKVPLLVNIYQYLIQEYGPQGWWPLLEKKNCQIVSDYHTGKYDYPRTEEERFEICIGAILTQNTSWTNVEKGLGNLLENNLFNIENLRRADHDLVRESIRCVGYFNQKTNYLKNLADFLAENSFQKLESEDLESARKQLLGIKGVGPETADCILLYALNKPSFVIDAYTHRFLSALNLISDELSYDQVKKLFENSLDTDTILFQEYHALLVQHGKNFYSRKPYGVEDRILSELLKS